MQLRAERFEDDATLQPVESTAVRIMRSPSFRGALFARTRNPETVRRCWIPGLRPRGRIPE
jgi:hypothetical protein